MDLPQYRMKGSHENDRWLTDQFRKIPQAQRWAAMNEYSALYKEAGENCDTSYQKTVKASYAANVWLREYVNGDNIRKPRVCG